MSWAESTGVERQGLKVSCHHFLTEVTCLPSFNHGFLKGA